VTVCASAGGTLGPTRAAAQPLERPAVSCESCLVLDLGTGRTLFRRAIHQRLPNASTTKMVTALITATSAELRERVRVSPEAAGIGGGGLDLQPGEVYRVGDLLYALLLDSSNEAAAALAEHVGPGAEGFVEQMNELAASLGADDTHFQNPHGLDERGHFSSADDLALIAQQVLAHPVLADIVATPRHTISVPGGSLIVENRNLLLESYRGAIGVKTGRTLGAGEVLVAAARRGAGSVIAVAMRSTDAAADARALLDYGFARLAEQEQRAQELQEILGEDGLLLAENEEVGALVFDPAGAAAVVAGEDVSGLAPPEGVEITFTPAEDLLLPLRDGEEVGTVELTVGDSVLATTSAVVDDAIPSSSPSWGAQALSGLLRAAASLASAVAA
jgi:serine-type D-Ala-D-Ala carboxypeptidase (penicillin-binding protein 5/6)